jgi:hypothetical protein
VSQAKQLKQGVNNMNAIATTKRSKRVLSSMPVHEHRERLLAIRQQTVRVATPQGMLDAELVKILRIDHRPLTIPNQSIRRPIALRAGVAQVRPQLNEARPALETNARSESEQKQFRLRSVGEVLTDQNGALFEVRGEELHRLGKLVRDSHGRMFEVCQRTNEGPTASQDIDNAELRRAEHADQKADHIQTPLQFLKALLKSWLPKWFRRASNTI